MITVEFIIDGNSMLVIQTPHETIAITEIAKWLNTYSTRLEITIEKK